MSAAALPSLDGWAVVSRQGRGIDDSIKAPGVALIGRRVTGYSEARGATILIPEIDLCWREGGTWVVRTTAGRRYRLGEPIWTQIKGGAAQVGGER